MTAPVHDPPAADRLRLRPTWRELALTAIAAATFALVVLVAPWQRVDADGGGATFVGYAPLYRPPEVPPRPADRRGWGIVPPLPNVRLDRSRLALELVGCGLAAALVAVALRDAGRRRRVDSAPAPEIER